MLFGSGRRGIEPPEEPPEENKHDAAAAGKNYSRSLEGSLPGQFEEEEKYKRAEERSEEALKALDPLEREIRRRNLFSGGKSVSSTRKMRRRLEGISEAENKRELASEISSLRNRALPKFEAKMQRAFQEDVAKVEERSQHKIEKADSEHEVKRLNKQLESEKRKLQSHWDNTRFKELRNLERKLGGSGTTRPKF